MEWLKTILEQAKLNQEGKLDVDAVMSMVNAEFSKHAVPKNVFNDKNMELKTANDTIAELKKANGDNAELQKKVADYEKEIGELKTAAEVTARTYTLKEALSKAGVIDPGYLIYRHGGVEKFSFDKENNPVGVEETLKPYKADKALAYLFTTEGRKSYNPQNGGRGADKNPFAKESYNMTEQAKLYRENPEQARSLAAAAGVTI